MLDPRFGLYHGLAVHDLVLFLEVCWFCVLKYLGYSTSKSHDDRYCEWKREWAAACKRGSTIVSSSTEEEKSKQETEYKEECCYTSITASVGCREIGFSSPFSCSRWPTILA